MAGRCKLNFVSVKDDGDQSGVSAMCSCLSEFTRFLADTAFADKGPTFLRLKVAVFLVPFLNFKD